MSSHDLAYYQQRAADERKFAELATSLQAKEVHQEMASKYAEILEQPLVKPKLRLVL